MQRSSAHPGTMITFAFLTYLVAYRAAISLSAPTLALHHAFWTMHVAWAITLLILAWPKRRLPTAVDWLFWIALGLAFLIPGAYLEYPSDPWEHFRRLTSWDYAVNVRDSNAADKFSYFWGWTFITHVPIYWRQAFLGFYGTIWELLVSIEVFRLCRRLGQSKSVAYLQIIGFWILFGNNAFSFRYYAISSTALAYLVFLQSVIWMLDLADFASSKKWRPALGRMGMLSCGSIPLIYFNHLQELIFLCLAAAAIGLTQIWHSLDSRTRPRFAIALTTGGAVCMLAGLVLPRWFPAAYSKLGWEHFTRLSTFRPWQKGSVFMETYGVPGILAIGLALYRWRQRPAKRMASALTLAPTLSLLLPPLVFGYCFVFADHYPTYRILMGFPLSFIVVEALAERLEFSGTALAIVALGALPYAPWRGRLIFQFYRPPAEKSLRDLAQTAEWVHEHRPEIGFTRQMLSDPMTGMGLAAYLGHPMSWTNLESHRVAPQYFRDWQLGYATPEMVRKILLSKNVQAFLMPDWAKLPPAKPSYFASIGKKWSSEFADPRYLILPPLRDGIELLAHLDHWTRTEVPPYYILYEAPKITP